MKLGKLPSGINKLVFALCIDGQGTIKDICSQSTRFYQGGKTALEAPLLGSDYGKEKSVICMEIYRAGEWKFNFAAKGFKGDLSDLLKSFGGEEI